MSDLTDTFIDTDENVYAAWEGEPTATCDEATPYAPTEYARPSQQQALVDELSRRQSRNLTTRVLLGILRYTAAEATALLAPGGLDTLQARLDANATTALAA